MNKRASKFEVDEAIRVFTNKTHSHFDNHGFAAGWLGATLSQLLMEVPAHKQNEIMRRLQITTTEYSGE
jgi:hypothetical protein